MFASYSVPTLVTPRLLLSSAKPLHVPSSAIVAVQFVQSTYF